MTRRRKVWRRVEATAGVLAYAYWERVMPRIPDVLLESVVYLFADESGARSGHGAGGTGFLVDYPGQGGTRHTYVVSNIHVVRNGCTTLRVNAKRGQAKAVTIPAEAWLDHEEGDDVCAAPIELNRKIWAVTALPWEDFCPTEERMAELNIGVGDDVLMIGRFVGHTGKQRNEPLARFGNIARMDEGERVKDGRGMLVEAFLVEMRSLPGYSGSPVFVVIGAGSYRGVYGTEKGAQMMPFYSETIGLLGIDTGHKPITNSVLEKTSRKPVEPPQVVQQNSGVAIVAPYYKIADVLEEGFVEQRKTATEDAVTDPERGVSDVDSSEEDEFERFEDLTRKLVNTPKRERAPEDEGS